MNKYKKYVVMISFFLFYTLLVITFIIINNSTLFKSGTIFVNDIASFKFSNNKWTNIKDINRENNKLYKVFIGNKNIGNYYLKINNKVISFSDKNNKLIDYNYSNDLFATRGNLNVLVKEKNKIKSTNNKIKYLYKELEKHKLSNKYNISYLKVYEIAIDNTSEKEFIIVASNIVDLNMKKVPDKMFSIIFMVKENKIFEIYYNEESDINKMCIPDLHSVISIGRINNRNIITTCDYKDSNRKKVTMYRYDITKFTKLISNN